MSTLRVTNLQGGSAGSAPNLPDGAVVTGVVTATSFSGSGANLTGIDATALKDGNGTVRVQANTTGAVVTGTATATTFSGNITGVAATFSGAVSVGGTLTYEDVTNVDSVGLITARDGVNISGSDLKVGVAFTVGQSGVVTATSFIGSGANLTNLPPGGNVISGIASGSLPNDRAVGLAQDGKVFQVATNMAASNPFSNSGSTGNIVNASVFGTSATYVPTVDRAVLFWRQGSLPRWHLLNGTSGVAVANDYISNSDPGTGLQKRMSSCWDPDQEHIIAVWSDTTNNHQGVCAIGTVSETGIGWGTPVVFSTLRVDWVNVCYDTTQDRVVIVYEETDGSNNRTGCVIVGTVSSSSNTITFGTKTTFNTTDTHCIHCVHDVGANKILITYENKGGDTRPKAQLATVANTGNTITMVANSDMNIDESFTSVDVYSDLEYDPDTQKSLFAYKGNSNKGWLKVLTISGNTVSAGSAVKFYDYNLADTIPNLIYDTSLDCFLLSYIRPSHSNISSCRSATISGTSVTVGNEMGGSNPSQIGCYAAVTVTKPGGRAIATWIRNDNEYPQKVLVNTATATPNIAGGHQYIGFADQVYTNGQTATIKTIGNTVETLSGLTTASTYYVQGDGTVGLTWDSSNFASFASNTPKAGKALNSTTLQIADSN